MSKSHDPHIYFFCNGKQIPTKTTDPEEKQLNQATDTNLHESASEDSHLEESVEGYGGIE